MLYHSGSFEFLLGPQTTASTDKKVGVGEGTQEGPQGYPTTDDKEEGSSKEHMTFTSLDTLNTKYKNKTNISPKLAKDNITIYKR